MDENKKIEYGWSSDEKYYIEDNKNIKYLLRISNADTYEQKRENLKSLRNLIHRILKCLEP